jgi:hypothetical protein
MNGMCARTAHVIDQCADPTSLRIEDRQPNRAALT